MDLTGKTIKVQTLSGASFDQENDLDHPDNVKIENSEFKATSAAPELELNPHSFTIVTIGEPEPNPEPQPTRHTVDFLVDGNKVASLTAVDGKLEGEAPVPTKDGWTFEGWFTKDGVLFDFSKSIDRDMVLTAKWSKPLTGIGEAKPVEPAKPQEKPQATPNGGLPQTGDPASFAAMMGFAGAALAVAGAKGRKRRS